MSRISVVIPNYNRANLIEMTIDNMLRQTVPPAEIIVVDDGSTDHSLDVIRKFGNKVHLIEQHNQGPGAARNRGLNEASGEFIQFMDSDDLISLNKLEVQLSALEQSSADFAYGPWIRTIVDGKQLSFAGPVLQSGPVPGWKPMLEWQLGSWCTIFQSCLFRRHALEKAGRYRTDMQIAEDGEYLVRILQAGAQPTFTGECLVLYRTHEPDQISGLASSQQRQAQDLTLYFEQVGQILAEQLSSLHQSTCREAALLLYQHNRYCQRQGWPVVNLENPLSQLLSQYPPGWLWLLDIWERLVRKVFSYAPGTPLSTGLAIREPSAQEEAMVAELGYTLN